MCISSLCSQFRFSKSILIMKSIKGSETLFCGEKEPPFLVFYYMRFYYARNNLIEIKHITGLHFFIRFCDLLIKMSITIKSTSLYLQRKIDYKSGERRRKKKRSFAIYAVGCEFMKQIKI